MHEVMYWTYGKDVDKGIILAEIEDYVWHHSDGGGYHNGLKWHKDKVYDSYSQAQAAIYAMEKGPYDDHAVLYREQDSNNETAKAKEYKQKAEEMYNKKFQYIKEHSVKNFKAEYIGCGSCGSKLARKHLFRETCPVCGKDLRSETVQKKIQWFDDKRAEYFKKYDEEMKKTSKKINWLVKFEYHC